MPRKTEALKMTVKEREIAFLKTIFWETQCKFFLVQMLDATFCWLSWQSKWRMTGRWELRNFPCQQKKCRVGPALRPQCGHDTCLCGLNAKLCHFAESYYFSTSVYLWGNWFQIIRKSFLVDAKCMDTALKESPKLDLWKLFLKKGFFFQSLF